MVVPPAVTPVTVVVLFEVGAVIAPGPLTIVQVPVPGLAALPASVKVLVLHCAWSVPAAALGALYKVTEEVLLQLLLVIVQLSVAVVPTGTPVTVVEEEVGLVMVAEPLTSVHKPVPGVGSLADMV